MNHFCIRFDAISRFAMLTTALAIALPAMLSALLVAAEAEPKVAMKIVLTLPGPPSNVKEFATPVASALGELPVGNVTAVCNIGTAEIYVEPASDMSARQLSRTVMGKLSLINNALPKYAVLESCELQRDFKGVPQPKIENYHHPSVTLDREKIKEIGLRWEDVANTLEDVLSDSAPGRPSDAELKRQLEKITKVTLTTPGGGMVPLQNVAQFHLVEEPDHIVYRLPNRTSAVPGQQQ